MKQLILSSLLAVGLVTGFLFLNNKIDKASQFSARVAVVDMETIVNAKQAEVMKSFSGQQLSADEMKLQTAAFLQQTLEQLDNLRQKGFVVIPRKTIIGGPGELDYTVTVAERLGLVVEYDAYAPLSEKLKKPQAVPAQSIKGNAE